MIKFFKKHAREFIFSAVILLCVFLIGAAIVLLREYSFGLDEQARTRVQSYSSDTTYLLDQHMDTLNQKVHHASERLADCKTTEELSATVQDIRSISDYKDVMAIRFFDANKKEYNEFGYEYDLPESEKILETVGNDGTFAIGVIYDREHNTQAVAFYSSVEGSELIDSMVMIYPVSAITDIFDNADEEKLEYADFAAFCASDGEVHRVLYGGGDALHEHVNILEYLRSRINNKDTVDGISEHIGTGAQSVFSISIAGAPYVVSVGGSGENGGGMCVVGLYAAEKAYTAGYTIVNSILSTMIIIFVILICLLLYFMISGYVTKKKIYEVGSIDQELECYTVLGFQRAAAEILKRNKVTKFALIVAEVRFFNYITEHYGATESTNLLHYLKVVYSKAVTIDETYGYYADGQFFLLLHYKEDQALVSRLNKLNSIARRYPRLKEDNYTVKLNFGIYEIDRAEEQTVQNMLDKAIVAKNTMSPLGTEQPLKFYNNTLRENYIQTADIESRAEGALANDEFVVFYQPKLNVKEKCIEGCEALVRWYDPENNVYRAPATFLPIFETNGFITKVDKFVYEKVCKYISESIERRQTVYPVSVNISRLTAIQPDFREHYVNLKNQYHIPDGLLILEFTESFAYENYEVLNDTIKHMHRNGFLCSIDDFGSGYSSYNILKHVNMDEIKLDRFFIGHGISESRDRLILEHVINTAKTLGMKVTQEGVETIGELELLRELGCDVVQGYYYSKPLALVDYIAFLNEHVKK